MPITIEEIKETYPFLSIIRIYKEEIIGIIQNCDQKIISVYCYELMPKQMQPLFLEYGKTWWWESNRKLPVNMFIGKDFDVFSVALRSYAMKETEIIHGPIIRLSDLISKKNRKKTVQLVRRVD